MHHTPDDGGRGSLQSSGFLLHFLVADHHKDSIYVSVVMRVHLTKLLLHRSKDSDHYRVNRQLVYQEDTQ
jgi:hypothetical protein